MKVPQKVIRYVQDQIEWYKMNIKELEIEADDRFKTIREYEEEMTERLKMLREERSKAVEELTSHRNNMRELSAWLNQLEREDD